MCVAVFGGIESMGMRVRVGREAVVAVGYFYRSHGVVCVCVVMVRPVLVDSGGGGLVKRGSTEVGDWR